MHSESQWRYRAKRLGLRLVRYSQALGYQEYGPYGLVDRATGRMVRVRLDSEDVERLLFGVEGKAVEFRGGGKAVEFRGGGKAAELMVDGEAVEFSGFSKVVEFRVEGEAAELSAETSANENSDR